MKPDKRVWTLEKSGEEFSNGYVYAEFFRTKGYLDNPVKIPSEYSIFVVDTDDIKVVPQSELQRVQKLLDEAVEVLK